jgi:hypothetical protein
MPLPDFSISTRVSAPSARQDKIEFTFPLGVFRDTETRPGLAMSGISVEEVAEYLGAPPLAVRGEANQDFAAAYSAFFTRPTGRDSEQRLFLRREAITSLTHDERFETAPLCSGILNLEERGARASRFVTAVYWANLNPTRFVRYQDPNILRSHLANMLTPDLFSTRDNGDGDEIALDGADNWIPQREAAIWRSFTSDRNWPARLTDYFSAVETAMRGEMNRRAQLSSVDGTGTLYFTASDEPWILRRVETYWEFANDGGPELLETIDRAMRSFCALSYVRRAFEGSGLNPERTRQRLTPNEIAITGTAAPGIRVVVYAKTNRRIRFEVRHDENNLSPRSPLKRLMRSVNGVPGMLRALRLLSEDAAEVLNVFLNHLERVLTDAVVPWQYSATDFLFDVTKRCRDAVAAQVIVRLLVSEGGVSRTDELTPSIDALRRAGILERAANRQGRQSATFIPTPAYRAAVDYLAEIADVRRLTQARRQRPQP